MDITRLNFKSEITDIKSAISNACFVAIDCEFSGLNIDSESNINSYDSYEQYYNKLRRSVSKFLVLQFGLCAFRYDNNDKKFKQKCYNFYIFPRVTHKSVPDVRFSCQASSIDFLSKHEFDFNKVFKEGISYLNQSDASKYKQFLDDQKEKFNNSATIPSEQGIIPIPDEDESFVDETMKIIKIFLASGKDELMLPRSNAFRRRLIYQTTREKYGNLVSLETRTLENKDRVLFVQKPESPEMKVKKDLEKYEASLAELDDAVGFSRVIQHLSESRKLVIGHNISLDLLYTIDKFLTPLPEDYDEFKVLANCLLPRILDTKYMASTGPFKDLVSNTILGGMADILKNKPFEIPEIDIDENGQGYQLGDNKDHESGFDAFLTGASFLSMAKYLDKSENLHKIFEETNSKVLKPFINRIFLQRLQDGFCINLGGNDSKLNRDHVLHITFPKDWRLADINQMFSPFGNIHVAWLNDSSAYVALYRKDQATQALNTLSQSKSCIVSSYARHQTKIKPTKRDSGPTVDYPERKKRRMDPLLGGSTKKNDEQSRDGSQVIANRLTKMFDESSAWN